MQINPFPTFLLSDVLVHGRKWDVVKPRPFLGDFQLFEHGSVILRPTAEVEWQDDVDIPLSSEDGRIGGVKRKTYEYEISIVRLLERQD